MKLPELLVPERKGEGTTVLVWKQACMFMDECTHTELVVCFLPIFNRSKTHFREDIWLQMKVNSINNDRASVEKLKDAQRHQVDQGQNEDSTQAQSDAVHSGDATSTVNQSMKTAKSRYDCPVFATVITCRVLFGVTYRWWSRYPTLIAVSSSAIFITLAITIGILVVYFTGPKPTGMFCFISRMKAHRWSFGCHRVELWIIPDFI